MVVNANGEQFSEEVAFLYMDDYVRKHVESLGKFKDMQAFVEIYNEFHEDFIGEKWEPWTWKKGECKVA